MGGKQKIGVNIAKSRRGSSPLRTWGGRKKKDLPAARSKKVVTGVEI